jgi:hypothetical protein
MLTGFQFHLLYIKTEAPANNWIDLLRLRCCCNASKFKWLLAENCIIFIDIKIKRNKFPHILRVDF